jgi:hypothetical protein
MLHRRNGKVARLPRDVREQVNQMLDDGSPYQPIIDWLDANGHPGFLVDHISNWKDGGFQDWLAHQDQLSDSQVLRELTLDFARENEGSKTQEAAIHVAAALLYRTFLKFDPAKLGERLNLEPEHVTTLLNSFTRLNRRSTELDMIREYNRQQQDRRTQESSPAKGASDDTINHFRQKLDSM